MKDSLNKKIEEVRKIIAKMPPISSNATEYVDYIDLYNDVQNIKAKRKDKIFIKDIPERFKLGYSFKNGKEHFVIGLADAVKSCKKANINLDEMRQKILSDN